MKGLVTRAVCASGKLRFPSKAAANAELRRLDKEFKGDGSRKPRRAYACKRCGGHHLTSKT